MSTFKDLGLSAPTLDALDELQFHTPTEIQLKAIPHLLAGKQDFIGLAQTGTGKTAAFGLPLLERINPFLNATQALILAPTRELGQQIGEQVHQFSKYHQGINTLTVYGGASIADQIKALKKRTRHIIIATPGRLLDLIRRKNIQLDQLEVLVLDEADEMLNMGFKEELDAILSHTPEQKSTWLFSATLSKEISRIVQTYMDQPFELKLNKGQTVNQNIDHRFVMVRSAHKTEALIRFLDAQPGIRGLVFCRTRRETQALADLLLSKKYKADALHGDLSQRQRDRVMAKFKDHALQVLVATDVAARGIDVHDLTHVFHHSLPDEVAYYTHRSGRTARAGKKGTSIAFIHGREQHKIKRLEGELKIKFNQMLIPTSEEVMASRVEHLAQQVLQTPIKNRIHPGLLEQASLLFGNLSKEELLAKFLAFELNQIKNGNTEDLNERPGQKGPKSKRSSPRNTSRAHKKGWARENKRKARGKRRGQHPK